MWKQTTGLNRQILDKYYTSDEAVTKCIELIKKHITIRNNDLCIEPAAGDGSFINGIKSIFKHYRFYDLEPENSEIIKQDYFTFDYNKMIKEFYREIALYEGIEELGIIKNESDEDCE